MSQSLPDEICTRLAAALDALDVVELPEGFAPAVTATNDPKFGDYAIYEHCLPFNVSRAYDEARGILHPRIWTAQRDLDMWEALQG